MKELIATTFLAAYLLTLLARWFHPALFTENQSLALLVAAIVMLLLISLRRSVNS